MILKAYAIYDTAANAFLQPFYMQNDGMAIRGFSDAINGNPESQIYQHPDHYSLYYVGEWNDTSGYLTPHDPPRRIIHGFEVKNHGKEATNTDIESMFDEIANVNKKLDQLLDIVDVREGDTA